eukprot:14922193-Alexandrium_andersonii.AAC.1
MVRDCKARAVPLRSECRRLVAVALVLLFVDARLGPARDLSSLRLLGVRERVLRAHAATAQPWVPEPWGQWAPH